MGTETPADSGDKKPTVKNSEGGNKQQQRRDQRKQQLPKKERFNGAHPDLMGSIFSACNT